MTAVLDRYLSFHFTIGQLQSLGVRYWKSFSGRSRQGHLIAVNLTAQHHNSNDINGSMRNSSRNQAELNQNIAHQYGRKEHERGVSPLRRIHRPKASGSIVSQRKKQTRPPDSEEWLQRSATESFFPHAGTQTEPQWIEAT